MKKLLLAIFIYLIIWCFQSIAMEEILKSGSVYTLEETVVTATGKEEKLKDIGGGVEVITAEDIETGNIISLTDILKNALGMDIQESGLFGHKPTLNLRGLQGNYGCQRVLILQDGRPLNEPYLGDVDLRLIPVENIERIEIVRSPSSALYGTYAMGGVVNIITKSGK